MHKSLTIFLLTLEVIYLKLACKSKTTLMFVIKASEILPSASENNQIKNCHIIFPPSDFNNRT